MATPAPVATAETPEAAAPAATAATAKIHKTAAAASTAESHGTAALSANAAKANNHEMAVPAGTANAAAPGATANAKNDETATPALTAKSREMAALRETAASPASAASASGTQSHETAVPVATDTGAEQRSQVAAFGNMTTHQISSSSVNRETKRRRRTGPGSRTRSRCTPIESLPEKTKTLCTLVDSNDSKGFTELLLTKPAQDALSRQATRTLPGQYHKDFPMDWHYLPLNDTDEYAGEVKEDILNGVLLTALRSRHEGSLTVSE